LKYLFDASSLLYTLKLRKIDVLQGNYVQWLTLYESINALWKEVFLVKSMNIMEALKLISILNNILDLMNILNLQGLEKDVLKVAVKHGVTAYDASYIVLARKHGLTLVTEDRELKNKALKIVKAVSLNELIGYGGK